MSNSDGPQAPPPLPEVRPWWIAWLVAVIGGPLLAIMFPVMLQNDAAVAWTMAALATSGILHFVFSIGLAKAQARLKRMAGLFPSVTSIALSLLFLGWAIMLGVFFAGCALALSIATAMQ